MTVSPARIRMPSWKVCGYSRAEGKEPLLCSGGTPQVTHFHESPLENVVLSILMMMTWRPEYTLAGSGGAGAPEKVIVTTMWLPSGRKLPDWRAKLPESMHPVPWGLIEDEQDL